MDSKEITSILITRFSVRMFSKLALRGRSKEWLLDEVRLKQKLLLFRNITLPSVTRASRLPNHHLLLIDKELPDSIRLELATLIEPYPFMQIIPVDYKEQIDFRSIEWLPKTLQITSDFVLTVNLDDDDGLHENYFSGLMKMAQNKSAENDAFHWFGTTNVQEWDLVLEKNAPLGYAKPNSGGVNFVMSTGFAVLTRNVSSGPSIFCVSHSEALDILNRRKRRKNVRKKFVYYRRLSLAKRAFAMGCYAFSIKILLGWIACTDLSEENAPNFQGLLINHGDNLQQQRIEFGQELRTPMTSELLRPFSIEVQNIILTRANKTCPTLKNPASAT